MPETTATAEVPIEVSVCWREVLRQALEGVWPADLGVEPLIDRIERRE